MAGPVISRTLGWQGRLNDAIAAAEARPFDWNGWSCAHFVADAVLAMTGIDALADYRGKFRTEAKAWAVLAANDGTLAKACRRIFGPSVHPSRARAGDVMLMRGESALGISIGRGLVAFASDAAEDGAVARLPVATCLRAYPLGWPADVLVDAD